MSDNTELVGPNLKAAKKARELVSLAIESLNSVSDDAQEESGQIPDATTKLEDVISLLDEVIPDEG